MKFNKRIIAMAIAAALPWAGAQAQTNAELLQQIQVLKAQLEALTAKVEAQSKQSGGVSSEEFNRLAQKVELAEENTIASGFQGLKVKGILDVTYRTDEISPTTGFSTSYGNGGYGPAVLEIIKESDDGIGWTLRLIPFYKDSNGDPFIVHEATATVPLTEGHKLLIGLAPDFSGYEYAMANLNPFVTNNLLYSNAASNYLGAGMTHELGKSWTAKWMVGQVDSQSSRKAPGLAYRFDYSASEFSGVGFSGVHFRTNPTSSGANADMLEIDGYHTRGDLTLQGQFSIGRLIEGALDGSFKDARWWGVSGLFGYKVTPTLQALLRADYIYNRDNGGGLYYHPYNAQGPELDSSGVAADPSKGANLYALSTGFNYAINSNTQWKAEVRWDRATGYNFIDSNGLYKKGNTTFGTSVVVSF